MQLEEIMAYANEQISTYKADRSHVHIIEGSVSLRDENPTMHGTGIFLDVMAFLPPKLTAIPNYGQFALPTFPIYDHKQGLFPLTVPVLVPFVLVYQSKRPKNKEEESKVSLDSLDPSSCMEFLVSYLLRIDARIYFYDLDVINLSQGRRFDRKTDVLKDLGIGISLITDHEEIDDLFYVYNDLKDYVDAGKIDYGR
jgi:hypothetical protein